MVLHGAFGMFYTPVDMNTWCNQRHNVPYVFPETQQADNFTPPAALVASGFNFGQPVLGVTTVSFASIELDSPSQYIEQWSGSIEKTLGHQTTLEIGYLGAHGLHLQRAHLINNAPPGPGAIGPRRPFRTLSFLPGTVLPPQHCGCEHNLPGQHHQPSRELRPELVPCRVHQRSPPLYGWVHLSGQLHLVQEPDRCARLPFAHVRGFDPAEQQQSCRGERSRMRRPPPVRAQRSL